MTAHRFDTITKLFADRPRSRRQALATGGTGLAAAGLAATGIRHAIAQEDSDPESMPPPTETTDRTYFLFVQTFSNGTLAPHPIEPNRYTLTLTGHAAETVFFSDLPERIVGSQPTTQFLENLGFSPDNPPNAALVAGQQMVVLELIAPVYTETFGPEGTVTLTYDVVILEDYAEEGLAHLAQQANGELPETFDAASLFIDDCPDSNVDCWLSNPCRIVGNLGWRGTCWTDVGNGVYGCIPCDNVNAQCNNLYPECAANGGCAYEVCVAPQPNQGQRGWL